MLPFAFRLARPPCPVRFIMTMRPRRINGKACVDSDYVRDGGRCNLILSLHFSTCPETDMHQVRNALDIIGRILLAYFFIPSGIEKIGGYAHMAAYMSAHGVPSFLLPLVIILEIGGGVLLLVGWQTRIAAFLLGGFSILAVLIFHLHPADSAGQTIQVAELAVGGGLWAIAAHGAGGWSVDAWRRARRADPARSDASVPPA
jgi:putative oxidoreductase